LRVAQQSASSAAGNAREIVMKKVAIVMLGAASIALSFANAAAAAERRHVRLHHVRPPVFSAGTNPGDAYDYYYPGWGRPAVPSYGVYPGLIYGGATSPPTGH
jgi:hypothetical protein